MITSALGNGRYTLEKKLGIGTFSSTYKAIDHHLGCAVIIKTLAPSLKSHPNYPEFQRKFQQAAATLRQCQHPHLVRVLDSFTEQGFPFLVMEYIPGQTLGELLAAGAVLHPGKAVACTRQIGAALEELHRQGLIHGDVRPENIIRRQGTEVVVLTEVGIVCNFTLGIHQTYANLLSAGYAPPEYYQKDFHPSPADDLYGLAATCYCLLTGQPPAISRLHSAAGNDTNLFPDTDPRLAQAIFGFGLQAAEWRSPDIKTWLALLPHNLGDGLKPEEAFSAAPTSAKASSKATPEATKKVSKVNKVTSKITKPKTKSKQGSLTSPLTLLVFTGAIAGVLGIGAGLALRVYRPSIPGDTILHTDQSFPPRRDWPISESSGF